jgi:hypothetical protein
VVPDLVLTVDPQDVRYHFAPGDLDGVAALVNAVTVHPALFELPGPRVLTAGFQRRARSLAVPGGRRRRRGLGRRLGRDHRAVALASAWRCEPIVVVGLDLSFADGKLYVDTGSTDGEARIERGRRRHDQRWPAGAPASTEMKAAGRPAPARERVVELPGGTVEP